MVEITLTSKDEREFKVDAQVAIMSETVKSMLGIDDPSEEIDPPEAAIPLPAVEGNILELVLKCKTVADYIKQCKTPQEIRRRFNIKNDFTPEEEEEVRKENAWCEER